MILVIIVFALGGFIAYQTTGTNNQTPETTNVKIADLPVVHALPLYYAMEKGYFKDAGITVERVKFEAPAQLIDALMAGRVDMTSPSGAMGITGIADFKTPGKIKIYVATGGDDTVANDSLLVSSGSTISSIQDLKGKKLGVLAGIQWKTIASNILAKNGLSITNVTLVELAPAVQAPSLASGAIDALLAIEPMPTIVQAKGIGKILLKAPTLAIADPFYPGAGAIRVEFAQKNPKTTALIMEILARSIREIRANPTAAKQYYKGYTPLDDTLISKAPVMLFTMYDELTAKDLAAIQTFYDMFTTAKVVDGTISIKSLLYGDPDKKY